MTPKEYLSQYIPLKNEIKDKERRLKRFYAIAESASPASSKPTVGKISDKVGKNVPEIADLENEIVKLKKQKKDIEEAIEKVDNSKSKRVLKLKYIDGYTYKRISKIMNCSDVQVWRLHKKGEEKIKNVMKCNKCNEM